MVNYGKVSPFDATFTRLVTSDGFIVINQQFHSFSLHMPLGLNWDFVIIGSSSGGYEMVSDLRDCRILLAEDCRDDQRLVAAALSRVHAELTIVDNGQDAVDLVLQAWDQGRAFDSVLLDIWMPVLNGHCTTILLRESGYTGLIVAIAAADVTEALRERCLTIGYDEVVSKPFRPSQLIELISTNLLARAESDTSCL